MADARGRLGSRPLLLTLREVLQCFENINDDPMSEAATMSESPDPLQAEAKARWGGTEQYRESTKRAKSYTAADLSKIKAELEAIEVGFADALKGEVEPAGVAARALAERARAHIDRWYYPCSHEMHSALADMYTADERFREHYDRRAAGLAEYVSAAIKANAASSG